MTQDRVKVFLLMGLICPMLAACSLEDLIRVDPNQTGTVVEQQTVESFEGAFATYRSAVGKFGSALSLASFSVGRFTGEIFIVDNGTPDEMMLRRLTDPESPPEPAYPYLQQARVAAQQAGDLLRRHGGAPGKAALAHVYAMRAYAIVLLGELYCSGVPLTSVPYGGELQYSRGYTTTELFQQALAVLDTGDQIGTDSLPVLTLLRVARGRALLNLGRFQDAATAVAAVETQHGIIQSYTRLEHSRNSVGLFWTSGPNDEEEDEDNGLYIVLNSLGTNGLDWLANDVQEQDPRVPVSRRTNSQQVSQNKFGTAEVSFVIADGIEARLIEAEALLQPAQAPTGNWLGALNTLRRTVGLADTTDPGTAAGRIDLLFRERAFWLYLTGHRLGDMRRLVRQYQQSPLTVFPIGFPPGSTRTYGNEFVLIPEPIGKEVERETNPYYEGCTSRNP